MTRDEILARRMYVSPKQAAEFLGVTDRGIRKMISDGRLKGYKLGPGVLRLRLDEIEAALQPVGG